MIGEWRTPECRTHRSPSIRHKRGIYAFAVNEEVKYVGKAETLHRRLRNYSNRCFGALGKKERRYCHDKIVEAVDAHETILAYALVIDQAEINLLGIESALLQRFTPSWNRN